MDSRFFETILQKIPIPTASNLAYYGNLPFDMSRMGIQPAYGQNEFGQYNYPNERYLDLDPKDIDRARTAMQARLAEQLRERPMGGRQASILDRISLLVEGGLEPDSPNTRILQDTGGRGSAALNALTQLLSDSLHRPYANRGGLILDPRVLRSPYSKVFSDVAGSGMAMDALNTLGGLEGKPSTMPGVSMAGDPTRMDMDRIRALFGDPSRQHLQKEAYQLFREGLGEESARLHRQYEGTPDLQARAAELLRHPGVAGEWKTFRPAMGPRETVSNLGVHRGFAPSALLGEEGALSRFYQLSALENTSGAPLAGGALGGERVTPSDFRKLIGAMANLDPSGESFDEQWERMSSKRQAAIAADLARDLTRVGRRIVHEGDPANERYALAARDRGGRTQLDPVRITPSTAGGALTSGVEAGFSDKLSTPRAYVNSRRDRFGAVGYEFEPPMRGAGAQGEPVTDREVSDRIARINRVEERKAGRAARQELDLPNPVKQTRTDYSEGLENSAEAVRRLGQGAGTPRKALGELRSGSRALALQGLADALSAAPQYSGKLQKPLSPKAWSKLKAAVAEIKAIQSRLTGNSAKDKAASFNAARVFESALAEMPRQVQNALRSSSEFTNLLGVGVREDMRGASIAPNEMNEAELTRINRAVEGQVTRRIKPSENTFRRQPWETQSKFTHLPGDRQLRGRALLALDSLGLEQGRHRTGKPSDIGRISSTKRKIAAALESEGILSQKKGFSLAKLQALSSALGGRVDIDAEKFGNRTLVSHKMVLRALGLSSREADALRFGDDYVDPDKRSATLTRKRLSRNIREKVKRAEGWVQLINEAWENPKYKAAIEKAAASGDPVRLRSVVERVAERIDPQGRRVSLRGPYDSGRGLPALRSADGFVTYGSTSARAAKPTLFKVRGDGAKAAYQGKDGEWKTARRAASETASENLKLGEEGVVGSEVQDEAFRKERNRVRRNLRRHRVTSKDNIGPGRPEESPSTVAGQREADLLRMDVDDRITKILGRAKPEGALQVVNLNDKEYEFFRKNERLTALLREASAKNRRVTVKHRGTVLAGRGSYSDRVKDDSRQSTRALRVDPKSSSPPQNPGTNNPENLRAALKTHLKRKPNMLKAALKAGDVLGRKKGQRAPAKQVKAAEATLGRVIQFLQTKGIQIADDAEGRRALVSLLRKAARRPAARGLLQEGSVSGRTAPSELKGGGATGGLLENVAAAVKKARRR